MIKNRVAIVDIGERLPFDCDLSFLSQKLNSLQNTFTFEIVNAIPAELLGEPDLGGQWYYFKRLFEIVQKHQAFSQYDYFVGVTHVRLTEDEDSEDDGNRDYFSMSDLNKVSLVSLNHNITVYNSRTKDIYQFLSFSIAGELLCNLSKEYLYHNKVHYCLFDECIDRANVAPAIENSKICSDCFNLLKKKGISDSILHDINNILNWCRRNTGKHSPLYRALIHPITSLTIGAAIGWLSSAFLKPSQYLYVFIGAVTVPISLFLYYVSRYKRKLKQL